MQTIKKFDVIVIGGGPVGMWAAYLCKMMNLETVLIEASSQLGGQCVSLYPEKPIFDIPALFGIKGEELARNLSKQLKEVGPEIFLEERVRRISECEGGDLLVETPNLQIKTKGIILSVGLGIPTPNRPSFQNLQDLEKQGFVEYSFQNINRFKAKTFIILGGGYSAADWVINLEKIGATKIYLVHPAMRSIPLLQSELEKVAQRGKFTHFKEKVHAVEILGDKVVGILSSGERIEADYIIPCYGVSLDNDPIELELERDNRGKFLINSINCATKNHSVCAIGDAASGQIGLICVGFGDAAKAAYHLVERIKGQTPTGYSTTWFAPKSSL